MDNLRKHYIIVMDWCYMCKKRGKSPDHLFLNSDIARELWNLVSQMFGIEWMGGGALGMLERKVLSE
jgi:hypothetical protein